MNKVIFFLAIIVFAFVANAEEEKCAKEVAKGRTIRYYDFEDPTLWRDRGANNVFYNGGHNNLIWGRKDLHIRPCQGYEGTGLMFDMKGISQGEMQFWSPNWPMKKDKYYKVTYMARAVNYDGSLGVKVRGIAGWKVILQGHSIRPTSEWKEYSFSGRVDADYTDEIKAKNIYDTHGLMFTMADIGTVMIDNVRIEEFDENPNPIFVTKNPMPVKKGNLIPNSSLEIKRNKMWATMIPQNDPALHFTDPGFVRVEGGKFGKYCCKLEGLKTKEKGGMSTESIDIPVPSGVPLTYSFWYKGKGRAWAWVGASTKKIDKVSYGGSKLIGEPKTGWSNEWQRCVINIKPLPEAFREMHFSFQKGGEGELLIDGLQLEVGEEATEYRPGHPYEIEATVKGGMPNIVAWGEKLPIELTAYKAIEEVKDEKIPATLKLIAYPNKEVYSKDVMLIPGKTQTLNVEPGVNGIYRIELTAKDGNLAPRFENIAARLPKPREDVGEESFFGTHISVRPYYANYAHRIGIKWQRMHDCSSILKMKWGNPEKDVYQWHDESIDMLKNAGLYILGMPDYFSNYAKREKGDERGPIDNEAFGEWCKRVAEHYKGRVDYWEVINEPYMGHFYPGSPKDFAETFEVGAKKLKEGNPNAKILGWCTELMCGGFASKFSKENISNLDANSVHVYFCATPGGGTIDIKDEINLYRKTYLKGDGNRQIWNTEGSWGGASSLFYTFKNSDLRSYISSAACGSRIWLAQMSAGFERFFFFTMHQTDGIRYRGGYKMLLEYDRTVTVAAVATSVTAWFVDGLKPQKIEHRIKGAEESIFSGKGRSTYVVYRDPLATKPVKIDISKLPSNFLVCDVMGTDLRKQKEKVIELTKTPIFVLSEKEDFQSLLKYCQGAVQ